MQGELCISVGGRCCQIFSILKQWGAPINGDLSVKYLLEWTACCVLSLRDRI